MVIPPFAEVLQHTAPLWRWSGAGNAAAWHFLTIDGAAGEALSATALLRRMERTIGGFGSLKVAARIGGSTFRTSVFPSRERGWLLPVKAAVRRAEDLAAGDEVSVVLEV